MEEEGRERKRRKRGREREREREGEGKRTRNDLISSARLGQALTPAVVCARLPPAHSVNKVIRAHALLLSLHPCPSLSREGHGQM